MPSTPSKSAGASVTVRFLSKTTTLRDRSFLGLSTRVPPSHVASHAPFDRAITSRPYRTTSLSNLFAFAARRSADATIGALGVLGSNLEPRTASNLARPRQYASCPSPYVNHSFSARRYPSGTFPIVSPRAFPIPGEIVSPVLGGFQAPVLVVPGFPHRSRVARHIPTPPSYRRVTAPSGSHGASDRR